MFNYIYNYFNKTKVEDGVVNQFVMDKKLKSRWWFFRSKENIIKIMKNDFPDYKYNFYNYNEELIMPLGYSSYSCYFILNDKNRCVEMHVGNL